ncbi:UNVERIFIED_CONTAM: hypothetical protein GTU68_050771, partial [Idotea baltica]|nr:hypothetical protein [Idotea baltica]
MKSWEELFEEEYKKDYFKSLKKFLAKEIKSGKTIYPNPKNILAAFDACPFKDVKVVLIGQDPYHGPKQAHGLSFSVQDGIKTPPSLQNIYKEIKTDLGHEIPTSGNLTTWAKQGVLLLNT